MIYLRCVIRTVFYILLTAFTLTSLQVIRNPEDSAIKYLLIKQSTKNIFNRTTFEEFKPKLKYYSILKLKTWNNHFEGFEIIEDGFMFEDWYWCKYQYIDQNGEKRTNIDHVINNWKSWEYYVAEHDKNFITEEHVKASILRKEWMDKYRDPEIEKYRRYQIN
jgi:hypothetical protein